MPRFARVSALIGLLLIFVVGCGSPGPQSAAPAPAAKSEAKAPASAPQSAAPAPTIAAQQAAPSGPVKTLRLVTLQTEQVETLNKYVKDFETAMPGYTVEVTVVPGVAEFNAAMAAKLAAGDPPDIMIYQWSTQIQLFAKGGHLMDLSGKGFEDRLKVIKKKLNVYEGKTYAFPIQQSVFGVFFNQDVGKKYGVTEMPKTFSEFLAACETMKKNGLQTPVVIPAADGSGATAFNFGYLHQVVSGKNPDFYKETLEGTKHWNGPEFRALHEAYAKILKYSNEDLLGLDPEGARRRFAKGEAAFFLGGSWNIVNFRQLNPDLNFILAPTPWVEDVKDYTAISDYESAISISSKTKYPEAALKFLDVMFTVENGNLFAKNE